MQPIVGSQASCKCCSQSAPLYGVVDFHRHCSELRSGRLPVSGSPIYYYRCPQCGFLFTTAFDHFTRTDFAAQIYNDGYAFVDPDFAEVRPCANARAIADNFGAFRRFSLLDYGGGNGRLAAELRLAGFTNVATYDPFVPEFSARPAEQADLILSFEVVEHSCDPLATFRDVASFLAPRGSILFSTLIQPGDFDAQRMNWWYIGPRNGHVSLHSQRSLAVVAERCQFLLRSINENYHLFYRADSRFL